jgi:hypothetical protein
LQDYDPGLFCSYAAHLATQPHILSYSVVYHPKYELNMKISQTVVMCICQLVLGLSTCLLHTVSSRL